MDVYHGSTLTFPEKKVNGGTLDKNEGIKAPEIRVDSPYGMLVVEDGVEELCTSKSSTSQNTTAIMI